MKTKPATMLLVAAVLPTLSHAQTVNICDRTPQVRGIILVEARTDDYDCAAVDSEELANIGTLVVDDEGITTLKAGDFDGLTGLQVLGLGSNQLTTLPAGLFDDLTSLQRLDLRRNRLTTLPAGLFDNLTSLQWLDLSSNPLASLPAGVFDGLTSLISLHLLGLHPNAWSEGLTSLQNLSLRGLTTLPAGAFDGLTGLQHLDLNGNRLTTLPAGAFDGLTSLEELYLNYNRLTTLPAGAFDGLTGLQRLDLSGNRLTTLPAGVFDNLTGLQWLNLDHNHLVGLTTDAPLFAGLPSGLTILLGGQTEAPEMPETPTTTATRLAAAVPLLVSASDSMRQGFVRIMNFSAAAGTVRIIAYDDAGNPANPVEVPLAGYERKHFNSGDLENGNPAKGIESGIGSPTQGDWRLDVETALSVLVLSYVRTGDGFLAAMHDRMHSGRWDDGRRFIAARTFNPGSNTSQVSKLRLVNTGENAESVRIDGWDDQGNQAGPVTLTLAAAESRTLTAQQLEEGAQGLTGMLGDGRGKWDLYVTARGAVIGMSLLESPTGHLSNISTTGVWVASPSTGIVPLLATPRPSH